MRPSLPSERLAALSAGALAKAEASAKAEAGRPAFNPTEASIRERFAMVAGALQCVAAMLPAGESHVVRFTGRWAHLGAHPVRRILDLADEALDMGRCAGCEPSAIDDAPTRLRLRQLQATPGHVGAGKPDQPERCPECGTTTGRHSPECGASWSPDYRREPAPQAPVEPVQPDAPEQPDKAAFDAIEREISRLIGVA